MSNTKLDSRSPEGRKALRLMTIEPKALIASLGLPDKGNRPYYSKATLCLMAVTAGLTPRDFL